MDGGNYFKSELAKLAIETIGHQLNTTQFDEVVDPTGYYFKLWFFWSIFNFGLLGGLAALQLNTVAVPKVSSDIDAIESPSE